MNNETNKPYRDRINLPGSGASGLLHDVNNPQDVNVQMIAKMRYIDIMAHPDLLTFVVVQGVSTRHTLYLLLGKGGWPERLVYVAVPDSGSHDGLVRWANKEQIFRVWDLDFRNDMAGALRVERKAALFVVNEAMNDVEQEAGS